MIVAQEEGKRKEVSNMDEKKKIMEEISGMTEQLREDDLQKLKGVIIGIRLARDTEKEAKAG